MKNLIKKYNNIIKKYNNIKKYIKNSVGGHLDASLSTMLRFYKGNKSTGSIYKKMHLEVFIKRKTWMEFLWSIFYIILIQIILEFYAFALATSLSDATLQQVVIFCC